jgi:hypothetical protein
LADEDRKGSSTPTEKSPTIAIAICGKSFQALGAVCSSFGSVLIHRQLREQQAESVLRQYLVSILTRAFDQYGNNHLLQSRFHCPLPIPAYITSALPPITSREFLIGALAVLVSIYWYCVVTLFAQERWKHRYLPWLCGIGLPSLLIGALLVQNATSLFLEVFVGILDVSIAGCLVADFFTC